MTVDARLERVSSLDRRLYGALMLLGASALVLAGAPSWLALASGLLLALVSQQAPPAALKTWTTRVLQLGVVALGAGMNLETVWRVGSTGASLTALGLVAALGVGITLGRWLRVPGETALLISVGTAICGGSAIAAVASVTRPKAHEISIALAVVFVLNALGLLIFPAIGHGLGLPQEVFGRWAALAIHDTSSVVGAGLAYGQVALEIATTTKLARALWIVPLTIGVALIRRSGEGGKLRDVRWPWFILGFVLAAALATWSPAFAALAPALVTVGRRAMVLALFLIGASLSRDAIARVGFRPFALGVGLWVVVALASLGLTAA